LRIIENMLRRAGQHTEPHWPLVDVRLPDGAYASIIMPPHAVNGPTIAIRKYPKLPLRIDDLVQLGSMTQEIADFLSACVQGRLNIIVCGSNGSGRTTLLNALSSCIPASERIVTIEDMAELKLEQRYVVALESRQAGTDSTGQVTARDLVAQALRMGAERIIVGECRGSEIVKLLQAMYSGYSGVLMTMYAQNLRDCLTRLEVICQAGHMNQPLTAIRAQIAGAVNVIVYISLLRDGSRKIMNVAEVRGIEDDTVKLQSIFYYQDTGIDAKTGNVKGIFRPSGFRPMFMPKLEAANIRLPREMFVPFHIASSSRKQ
jgi:pilus assembly protein CpaF